MFLPDSDSCPDVGIRSLLPFSHQLRAGPVLLTLLFFPLVPSSSWVLRGSIYSFPLVRYSCPLSAGVLHARLSEGVSLMYPWREMHSTSTYSSAILFSVVYFLCALLLLLLSRFSRVRLCDPIDGSPPGSPVPGILQARTLEWEIPCSILPNYRK